MAKVARTGTTTVCLLSPHPGLLGSLQRILHKESHFRVIVRQLDLSPGFDPARLPIPRASVFVVEAGTARPAIESLIDVIRAHSPKARVLIIKETLQDEALFPYLRLGAKGVVRHVDVQNHLVKAVRVVAANGFWVPRSQLSRFVDSILLKSKRPVPRSAPHLSRREREVLFSILQGLTNKEIATKLHISERTVKFHISHVLAKFGAQRRADLIVKHYQIFPSGV